MKRQRETRSVQAVTGKPWETLTLTTLSRDRNLFNDLLTEARDMAMQSQQGKLVVHTAWGTEWRPFGKPRDKRPLKSVVLATGVAEKIEEDIKAFLSRKQWYADRGTRASPGFIFMIIASVCKVTHTVRRHSLSQRVPTPRTPRFWKDIVHSSPCRRTLIRHLSSQPFGTGPCG